MIQKIEFGTDGIRGNAHQWPFTNESLHVFGMALYEWMTQKYGKTFSIMIGYDTRESAARIKMQLAQGLSYCSYGSHRNSVMLYDAGIIPTPILLWWAQEKKNIDVAIMISASHNPYYDNGIKIFDVATGKINMQDERFISDMYNRLYPLRDELQGDICTAVEFVRAFDWQGPYVAWCKEIISDRLWIEGLIVIDLAHGALSEIAPKVLRHFVSDLLVINADPDGRNINSASGALYPEVLKDVVQKTGARFGFAFDGDGDRVVVVDQEGNIRDGDDILFLLLQHPFFAQQEGVVATIMSNGGFEDALRGQGKKLIRTPVGDKYVAAALQEHNLLLGGEPSGHIIIRPYIASGDGLFVALKILETLVVHRASFANTFVRFSQVNRVLQVPARIPLEKLSCYDVLQKVHSDIAPGRMIVRYSGTESLIRITTEHSDAGIASAFNDIVYRALKNSY